MWLNWEWKQQIPKGNDRKKSKSKSKGKGKSKSKSRDKNKSRSFDYASRDEAARGSAQDDISYIFQVLIGRLYVG
jgi:hypothetical protein